MFLFIFLKSVFLVFKVKVRVIFCCVLLILHLLEEDQAVQVVEGRTLGAQPPRLRVREVTGQAVGQQLQLLKVLGVHVHEIRYGVIVIVVGGDEYGNDLGQLVIGLLEAVRVR